MKLIIRKNHRRPFPYFDWLVPIFLFKNKDLIINKKFKFDSSAIYKFNDEDQYDINKLFGFSIGLHHHNSFRFGWRPNKNLDKIEILGYEYLNKKRLPEYKVCDVNLNEWYNYQLKYDHLKNEISYTITKDNLVYNISHLVQIKRKLNIGYRLNLYFGGNKKAPHNIIIYKNK